MHGCNGAHSARYRKKRTQTNPQIVTHERKDTDKDTGVARYTCRALSTLLRTFIIVLYCGAWWRIGRDDAFRPEGRGFESRSSRKVGILGKSFTYSWL